MRFIFLTILFSFLLINNISAKEMKLIKEKSFTVNSSQLLTVRTDVGDVIVRTWDKNEVNVKIFGNKNAGSKMEFIFDQDEKGVEIIGEKEGGKFWGWFTKIDLKYEITVPNKFNLNMKTSGGDIVIKNISGHISSKTSGGDIFIDEVKGKLSASTSGGDIVLNNYTGDSDVSTSGGDIEIKSSKGKTSASTSGGDIVLKSSNGKVDAQTSGGDIFLDYLGENHGISLSTSGGDIDVKLPSDINADVEFKTSGGRVTSNFSNSTNSKVTKSKIIGKFNNGGNSVVCKTSGGDIHVVEK